MGLTNIFEAANGVDGVEVFVGEQPDLLFIHLTMPVIDGDEALSKIRRLDTVVE